MDVGWAGNLVNPLFDTSQRHFQAIFHQDQLVPIRFLTAATFQTLGLVTNQTSIVF